MRPADQIERLLNGLEDHTSAAFDQRTLSAMFLALEKSISETPARPWQDIGRAIIRSRITKLAAAAVLALAVLLLARHLTGREKPASPGDRDNAIVQLPQNEVTPAPIVAVQTQLARELLSARELFAAADAKGLLGLLDTGMDQTKITVAGYLVRMGETSAIPALQKLADQWQGPIEENPFLRSIEQLRSESPRQNGAGDESRTQGRMPGTPVRDQRITIQVSEKATGLPIANAAVKAFAFGDTEYHHYTTDEKGVTTLDLAGSTPEYVIVGVAAAGYVGQNVELWEVRGSSLPRTVQFSLEKGTVVGGVIQDPSGRPIQGASVETRLSEQPLQGFEQPCVFVADTQTTDEQGRWRSDGIPARVDGLWFEVTHPDFADRQLAMPRDLKLGDLRAERAVIVLSEGLAVTGRVTDAMGTPIAGAQLLAGMNHSMGQWIRTDTTGCFSCVLRKRVIQNQTFLLTVQVPGYASQRRVVPADADLPPVDFALQPAWLLIGRVVDSEGKPVEDVSVSAADWKGSNTIQWQTKTDSNGGFVWNYPPTDAIKISLYKAGYVLSWREVVPNGQEQTFVLAKAMTIRGTVTDSRTGEPIRRFKVVPGSRTNNGSYASWNTSDTAIRWFADGRYEYTFLFDAQANAVRIEADGYLPAESAFVGAAEQEATIDIALTRGEGEQGPSGYVFDANASPVTGTHVVWSGTVLIYEGRADVQGRVYTTTDQDGYFEFKTMDYPNLLQADNGQAPLLAVCDQGIGGASCEELARNGFIALKPWACVRGQWRIGSRLAVNQELCLFPFYDQALPQAGMDCMKVVTDEDGRFVFEKVYPGKFILYNETYTVEPGQTLDLLVGGAGRIVKGELVVPIASDVPIRAGLRLVPANAPVPFDKIPKPSGYERMSLEEVCTWLAQFNESPEGRAYWAWANENYPQVDKYLHVTMDDRCRFHIDNVEPGVYVLEGEVNSGGPYNSGMMSVAPGHEHLLSKPVGTVWHEFEVPLPANDSELDVPLDLGAVSVRSAIKPRPGDPAPDFDVPTFGPNRIRLADYRGKVLLLTFLSESCFGRYPEGLEELKTVYRRFHQDARYAQVSLLFSGHPLLNKKAIDEAGLDWPHGLLDGRGSKETREYGLPSKMLWTVLIGPQGQILDMDLSGGGLTQAIEQALATAP